LKLSNKVPGILGLMTGPAVEHRALDTSGPPLVQL